MVASAATPSATYGPGPGTLTVMSLRPTKPLVSGPHASSWLGRVRLSRRRVMGSALAGTALLLSQQRGPRAAQAQADATRGDARVSDGQSATLMAFAEVLIPSSMMTATTYGASTTLSAIIDAHAAEDAFRSGAAFLDRRSVARDGAAFASLDLERRRALVGELFTAPVTRTLSLNPYYYFTDEGRQVRRLWRQVAKPIIAGFYISSFGWQVVRYPRSPGQCSNLVDYQFPVNS
jgi:hypothetical protein